MPEPAIRQRPLAQPVYQTAMESGYSELQARIIAARVPTLGGASVAQVISPSLSRLDPPSLLPDIVPAVERIVRAIKAGEILLCVTDHDADGGNAQCVILHALCGYFMVPPARVKRFISHRMREGYGVSDALVDRIIAEVKGPALMITADQGSTDEPRIARLKAHGIDTVVTDHHEIPEAGVPASAVACVNPTRSDSTFPDRTVCGCHVAFLVMCAVRDALIKCKYIPESTPKLSQLAPYAAVATIGDCVDMATSANNRAIVRYGLYLMNTDPAPCWRALRRLLQQTTPFTAEDLAFKAIPMINASGRMDDAMMSVDFLMSKNEDDAYRLGAQLMEENERRKEVQAVMLQTALPIAALQAQNDVPALVIYLPEGHSGVHGIVASRLVEAFGRPAVCFSPKQGEPEKLSGSFRSIPGVHIREALVHVDTHYPGLIEKFGGHVGAAGASLPLAHLDAFQLAFHDAVAEQMSPLVMGPRVDTDGTLTRQPDLMLLTELAALEPYGKQFPAPVFEGRFILRTLRAVGDGRHLKLQLQDAEGRLYDAIWFFARANAQTELPVQIGNRLHVVYAPSAKTYRGNTTVDLRIQAARVIEDL